MLFFVFFSWSFFFFFFLQCKNPEKLDLPWPISYLNPTRYGSDPISPSSSTGKRKTQIQVFKQKLKRTKKKSKKREILRVLKRGEKCTRTSFKSWRRGAALIFLHTRVLGKVQTTRRGSRPPLTLTAKPLRALTIVILSVKPNTPPPKSPSSLSLIVDLLILSPPES